MFVSLHDKETTFKMHLSNWPLLFLLLTGYAVCNEETQGLCPNSEMDILEHEFNNNVTHITKEMFLNCNRLKELKLFFDRSKSYKIDADAFENLENLENFTLHTYKMPHVKKGFFKLTPSVKQIQLLYADIEEIDSDAFEDFKDLEEITIIFNKKWKHLSENLFRNLSKLVVIDLNHNSLEGLTWEEFKGLTNVKVLNLSFNRISSFDAEKIAKFMPNLDSIEIQINPLSCKDKKAFIEELKKKLNHSIQVGYKFNLFNNDSCEEVDCFC